MAVLSAKGKSTSLGGFDNKKNLGRFVADMDVAITGINKVVREEMARAVVMGWEGMVYGTPVRTGYTTQEWQVVPAGETAVKNKTPEKKRIVLGDVGEEDRQLPHAWDLYKALGRAESGWIVKTEEVASVASQMGAKNSPKSYKAKFGMGTEEEFDNFRNPKEVVQDGLDEIYKCILAKHKNGRYKKIKNFRIANTGPWIDRLEYGHSSQAQGWIKRNFQKMMRSYNAAKPGKLPKPGSRGTRFKSSEETLAMAMQGFG